MKSILCIDFPIQIITQLKLQHFGFFKICHFQNQMIDFRRYRILILPVEKFIPLYKQLNSTPTIPYGSIEFLEEAFHLGAEDYLKDNWTTIELILRLEKIMTLNQVSISGHTVEIGFNGMKVNNSPVSLTNRETKLMYLLYKNINSIVEYETLRHYIEIKTDNYEKSLYVTVSMLKKKLRKELPDLFPDKIYIHNISSIGYQLKISCG